MKSNLRLKRKQDFKKVYNYGNSVAIDGDYAVIGTSEYKYRVGCAYVLYFNGTGWETKARLTASDGETGDLFGFSVGISGDNIIIGYNKIALEQNFAS